MVILRGLNQNFHYSTLCACEIVIDDSKSVDENVTDD
jgi:hypothetical protein